MPGIEDDYSLDQEIPPEVEADLEVGQSSPEAQDSRPEADRAIPLPGDDAAAGPEPEVEPETPEVPPEPVEEYRIGDIIAGQYEVWEMVGSGGIGQVYKVRDRDTGTLYALKRVRIDLVTADIKERFEKESESWAQIRHPNLVEIFGGGADRDSVFVVMEYLEGLSLGRLLEVRSASRSPFGSDEVEPIFSQICQGLAYLHRVRPHGNLKPRNIIILPEYLKITDFGLAEVLDNPDFVSIQLEQGNAYYYLSPEKITDPDRAGERSDVYSLGAILYEMLTNTVPMGEIVNPSQLNPNLDRGIDEVILRALKEKPEDRYADIAEFFQAFYQGIGKEPPQVDLTSAAEEGPLPEPVEAEASAPEGESVPPEPEVSEEPEIPIETPAEYVASFAQENAPPEPSPPEPELKVDAPEPPAMEPPPEPSIPARDLFLEDIIPRVEGPELREEKAEVPPAPEPEYLPSPPPARSKIPMILGALGILLVLMAGAFFFLLRQGGSKLEGEVRGNLNIVLEEYRTMERTITSGTTIPSFQKAASEIEKIQDLVEQGRYEDAQPAIQSVVTLLRVAREDISQREREREEEQKEKQAKLETANEAILSAEKSQEEAIKGKAPKLVPAVYQEGVAKIEEARKILSEGQVEKAISLAQESQSAFILALSKASQPDQGPKASSGEKKPPPGAAVAGAPAKCPDGMVFIPSGNFKMGSPADDPDRDYSEYQNKPIFVREYCIDMYEHPNSAGSVPSANVTWFEARNQCQSAGKRLCTEAEWEKACKGPQEKKYPYGEKWDASACNTQDAGGEERPIAASGAWKKCQSGYGVFDLSGNMKEWTLDSFSQVLADRTVKGGSASRPDWATRCAHRENFIGTIRNFDLGFRCCKDPQ